jgi:hypothetical protein
MLDTKRNLIIFRKKGGRRRRPGIIMMIKNKITIVVSSETPKTAITKTTSLLTSRYQTAKSEQRAGSRMIRTAA